MAVCGMCGNFYKRGWAGLDGLGWAGQAWAGLGQAGLNWVGLGLGWAGLGEAGLGWMAWAGLGRAGLGWAGLGCAGLVTCIMCIQFLLPPPVRGINPLKRAALPS